MLGSGGGALLDGGNDVVAHANSLAEFCPFAVLRHLDRRPTSPGCSGALFGFLGLDRDGGGPNLAFEVRCARARLCPVRCGFHPSELSATANSAMLARVPCFGVRAIHGVSDWVLVILSTARFLFVQPV